MRKETNIGATRRRRAAPELQQVIDGVVSAACHPREPLGSVFLPALALEPFAKALADRGHDVTVVVPGDTSSVEAVLSGYLEQIAGDVPPIVIVHSNAGNYVPGIVAESEIAGVVFVDAVLPPLDGGATAAHAGRSRSEAS